MQALVVSTSLDGSSFSEKLAQLYAEGLEACGVDARMVSLKDYPLPRFDNSREVAGDPSYRTLHPLVDEADGLVLASPVYNWDSCAELKRFVEVLGTTPPDGSLRGAFFDKIVTFVNAGGLPHSYMAFSSLAMSMMLDFKCIINPYNVYVHGRQWRNGKPDDEAYGRIRKSSSVMAELMRSLATRAYRSDWEI